MQHLTPACLGGCSQLPAVAESISLGSLSLRGGGSRKQAGRINSQQNEYTEIAALLFLPSERGHKKINFSVGREWVCENVCSPF